MIKINLLPPEYAAAQRKKEQQILLGTVGGILVIGLVGFWGGKKARAASLEKEVAQAEAELKKYENIVAQIENIEKNKKRLTGKRDVIRNLNRTRLVYPVFFEDLLPVIPSNVWVRRISIKEEGKRFVIQMDSNAISNYALATWLTNLEESPHFKDPTIGPIAYSTPKDGGVPTLSFSLTTSYEHTGPMPLQELYQ